MGAGAVAGVRRGPRGAVPAVRGEDGGYFHPGASHGDPPVYLPPVFKAFPDSQPAAGQALWGGPLRPSQPRGNPWGHLGMSLLPVRASGRWQPRAKTRPAPANRERLGSLVSSGPFSRSAWRCSYPQGISPGASLPNCVLPAGAALPTVPPTLCGCCGPPAAREPPCSPVGTSGDPER